MTPSIIIDGQSVVAQCTPRAKTESADSKELSSEAVISKLRGANPREVHRVLSYIIQNDLCNPRFINDLMSLLTNDNPVILGRAYTALAAMRQKGVKFNPQQEATFSRLTNNAVITIEGGVTKITGSGILLPNGAVLEGGTICFSDNRWFVDKGDSAVISGVSIITEDAGIEWEVDLFFDGKDHQESETYVSINVSQGKLTIGSRAEYRGAMISLAKNNPFIPVDENDDIKFEAERGMTLTIENRKGTGLISKITVKTSNGEGYATINNGWIQAGIAAKGIVSLGLGRGRSHNLTGQSVTTAPFEVVLVDNAGRYKILKVHNIQYVLDTRYGGAEKVAGQGYRLIFNNYFQVGLLDLGEDAGGSFIDGFVPFKIDISLSGNTKEYTIEDFQALYPNVKLTGYIDSTNIKLTIDYLQSLPPKVRASIKGVDFPEKWKSAGDAYATNDGVIHLKRNTFNMPLFQHECAHILTFYYEKLLDEKIQTKLKDAGITEFPILVSREFPGPNGSTISGVVFVVCEEKGNLCIQYIHWNDIDGGGEKGFRELAKIYGVKFVEEGDVKKILIPVRLLGDKGLARRAGKASKILAAPVFENLFQVRSVIKITVETTAGSFEARWRSIAGDVYSKYVNSDTEYNINPGWTDNGIDDGPRHGCIRSYGSKNFWEDVATFVEQIWKNPDFFRSLVDSKSASYDSRYKQKLGLLLEYGFITQKQYDRAVGTPAKKIDTVK